jgi:hypothetical protein
LTQKQGGGKIKKPLGKKHGGIVVFMENLYKPKKSKAGQLAGKGRKGIRG